MTAILQSIADTTSGTVTIQTFLICIIASVVLGVVIASTHMYRNTYTKSFVGTLVLMPAIVALVIMLVNGNLGAGVAVMGAFSLVRFRSVPGTAREINSIFLAMAVGLACGMGYIGAAVVFVIIMELVNVVLTLSSFGDRPELERSLRITIPESLDYTDVFEEIFDKYVTKCEIVNVKTSSMGSLFKLEYRIRLKDSGTEKDMIDELRCRNGNLEIMCSRAANQAREEL